MTARPMTEGLERVTEDARDAVEKWDAVYKTRGYVEPTTIRFARALLSTSASVRGMREALPIAESVDCAYRERTGDYKIVAIYADPQEADAVLRALKSPALSGIETGEEQARPAASAPISHGNKDHDQ